MNHAQPVMDATEARFGFSSLWQGKMTPPRLVYIGLALIYVDIMCSSPDG